MLETTECKKRLLILGASAHEAEVVKRAKQLGYYVIVTDNNKNPEADSPAKFEADLAWDISWADTEALAAACTDNNVAGVLAGFSENRIDAQIRLCERLGLPCDITHEQLEITRDKLKFKALCRRHGISVVEEFDEKSAIDHLPVIIKPTDRGGSAGIKVVTRPEEFDGALQYSHAASPSDSVVIEKYLTDQKIDVYYLVEDGVPHLIAASDALMSPPIKGHEICQEAWIFPSRHIERWLRDVHPRITDMLKSIQLTNGYLTISAFAAEDGSFKCFETGLRLSGELSYKFVDAAYGYNYLDFLIARAMSGVKPQTRVFSPETPVRMLILNFFAHNGIIKDKKIPSENYVDLLAATAEIDSQESRFPHIGMYFSISTDNTELIEKALRADRELILTDENGQDMIAFRADYNALADLLIRHNWGFLLPSCNNDI